MRYYGKVGYAMSIEKAPSVYVNEIVERPYYGDVIKLRSKWSGSEKRNEDLEIGHQLSIVADAFATENFSTIVYAEFMGTLWKVVGIDVEHPRLTLTLGGVYNGEQA